MVVSVGGVVRFRHDLVDENLNDILHWWTTKHNNYARHAGIPDVIPDDFGLLMEQPTSIEAVRILRQFLETPSQVGVVGAKCRNLAARDFTEARFAAGVLDVLFPRSDKK